MGVLTEKKLKLFLAKRIRLGKTELLLRPARMSDAKRLNEIVNDEDVCRFLLIEPPVSLKSTVKHLKDQVKARLYVVAELDGKVVGSVSLRPGKFKKDVSCGFGIAFDKSVHGTGVARAAMQACLEWMRENGFRNCTAETFDENLRARKFYKKLGFHEVAYIPNVRRTESGKLGGEYVIQKALK